MLPPYRGPILANGEFPRLRPERPVPAAAQVTRSDDSNGFVKLALALIVMSVFVVATVMLGDDATLRGVGQSISRWLSGGDDSSQMLHPSEPVSSRTASSPPAPRR